MKKLALWMAFAVVLASFLSACTRSKSSGPAELPPPATTTSEEFPVMPTSVGNAAATQTAVVAMPPQSGGGEPAPTATPVPMNVPTSAPTPAPTQQPAAASQPTQAPKPATVATSVPATYTLHQGEFPYCLARRFNINPDTLLAVNGLSRGQWVYPGTTLTIPRGAAPFPYQRALRPHPTTYTVQSGDTFYSIACLFGDVWPEAIAAANGMSVNAALTPGQTIHIP